MDLYRLNLNLLVALDALFTEQSVTLAANKLFITQAAMSNNLQQLRKLFNDDLLIREKNRMVLTHFAKELQPKLHQVLEELHSLISGGQQFDSFTSTRVFRIAMNDYMAVLFLPELLRFLQEKAPQIKVAILALSQVKNDAENLDYDLILDKIFEIPATAKKQLLHEDRVVMLINSQHPLAKKQHISLKNYLAYQHIAVRGDPNLLPNVDQSLMKLGVAREIKISLPFIIPILKLVEESTDLIATIVESIAVLYKSNYQFVRRPLPFAMSKIEYYMGWHARHENDSGHLWLRQQLLTISAKLSKEYLD